MDSRKKNIFELTRTTVGQYRKTPKIPLSILADNIRSMHNIGAIFRTADAFLISEIILAGISGTPPHPEISKSALGADKAVAWRHVRNALSETERLKASGNSIIVLEQTHNSIPISNFIPDTNKPAILVIGNEIDGVDQQIVDIADHVIEIPQFGTKHSLNVSISAGIAIWHIFSRIQRNF